MSLVSAPLVFLDLETAGGDPRRHPILQVAAIAVDQRLHIQAELELKLQFDPRRATQASLRRAHFRSQLWREQALPSLLCARQLSRFLREHAARQAVGKRVRPSAVQLVAHQAAFDGPFLTAWFRRHQLYLPAHPQLLCTLQRAKWHFLERSELTPPQQFRLATLCQYFEIPFHAADAHDALADARAALVLYRRLLETAVSHRRRPSGWREHGLRREFA